MSTSRGLTIKQYQPVVQPVTVAPVAQQTIAATVTQPPAVVTNVRDDYERWYAETTPNNRMVLALRCGIADEISWALDRLLRICSNEKFFLTAIPGLTDALFEWPEWFVEHGLPENNVGGSKRTAELESLFGLPPDLELKRRHALEAVCIFRTATANNDTNVQELVQNPRTRKLILFALHRVKPDLDAHTEFLVNILEIFQDIASSLSLPPPNAHLLANPVPPILHILSTSTNRTLINASLSVLTTLFSNPSNSGYLTPNSPALEAAIRYLPLFVDSRLVEVCLNYLYAHLGHPAMAKAFLVHPQMPQTLKLLVLFLVSHQMKETIYLSTCPPPITAPLTNEEAANFELSKDDLDVLAALPEPQRCYEWMKAMFMLKADAEVTQVDFWTMYRDTFSPYGEIIQATDVIKNISTIYPSAQAMVVPGPPQRFVVRGVSRRKAKISNEPRFKCRWLRSQCSHNTAESPGELYEHILNEHLNSNDGLALQCEWSSCAQAPMLPPNLRSHVLTHLPPLQPPARHPSQCDVITLPSEMFPHPVSDPTNRPIIPPRDVPIPLTRPSGEPSSDFLTALLCIRVLFRTSFASADAAPKVDEDHFGFPGILDEPDEADAVDEDSHEDTGGEKRGRKAFADVRRLLEDVQVADEVLMGWIVEMINSGVSPGPSNTSW